MCATPAGGEAAEQHEGRGDQSSERQNDQDGERHTCSGMFAPPVPPLQTITARVNCCLTRFQDDDLNGEGGESPQRERDGDRDEDDECPSHPEVRVQRLMEEDPAFRRGRLRWMKKEQQRLLNLQQQNITKKLRGQNQSQGELGGVAVP